MKTASLVILLAMVFALPLVAGESGWKLVWSDEFNGTNSQPDPAKWNYEQGFVRNNEAQFYMRDRRKNARVENGKLILEAHREDHEKARYTSTSITTGGKFAFQYGRVEIRAKVPHGRGVWPALWMLGADIHEVGWPKCGEIDIMEYVGHERGTLFCYVHTPDSTNARNLFSSGNKLPNQKPWEDFHTYSMEWTSDRIDLFYDTTKVHSYTRDPKNADHWPFDRKMYLLMNIAVGGTWGGQKGIDDAVFPIRMEIDSVRIYQREKTEGTGSPKK